MSINNIQLPGMIIGQLYSNCLYSSTPGKPEQPGNAVTAIGYLGNNQKHITVLVNDINALYLPDESLQFLLGILNACKLTMEDIALINLAKNPGLSYTAITGQLKTETIIMFGLTPGMIDLPLQFPHYQVQPFNNQVYLTAVSLGELQSNKEEKLKLWNSLKKVFSI